ncbi:UDP-glucose 4-epimerase protein [Halorhabdus tiamatea SARL4B]|uniref:NAD-dependent epimerase/dehydratase n=1 Tax=Halorhabdus tiamatea SARL4B TaxID=1033806 RepID=F7PQC6_9EURY|nr:SDR family oxidoreductase [Halorhabdus tiamatea]ERJ06116.1 UDP-glucose 4-epimerase protein [Halorhabdus tiamatea SARL4B]CCQ33256.1 NAD-dependent epimerase/dehydratase [Halorhabdus tiamatea SARL4B]
MTRVAILGCGYVGCELARQLVDGGHHVVGVRRSDAGLAAVEDAGAEPVQADVTDAESLSAVPDAEWVVFAASAGGRDAEAARETYVSGLRTAIDHFADRADAPDRFVYTSSTGVYGDHDGEWVDEGTPIDPGDERTEVLATAERLARERPPSGIDGTVARFGGLYGPDRYRLDRYLDGPVTAGVLNMVHRDDAAGAVRFLLERDHGRGEVVNVVDDEPVEKWGFADWLAEQADVAFPPKQPVEQRLADVDRAATRRRIRSSKRVSNDRLREDGYEFAYPTFRAGYQDALEWYRSGETDR